jgi:hypothetical protein
VVTGAAESSSRQIQARSVATAQTWIDIGFAYSRNEISVTRQIKNDVTNYVIVSPMKRLTYRDVNTSIF